MLVGQPLRLPTQRHPEHQDDIDKTFDALVQTALAELTAKQSLFAEKIAPFARWDIDLASGKLRFSNGPGHPLAFSVTVVGTFLPDEENWAWGWANDSLPPDVVARSARLRRLAAKTRYALFDTPHFRTGRAHTDTWCALALKELEGVGLFKSKEASPWFFFVVG
jgi:hypothetical protein